jgi:hypothetical protein
MNIIRKRRRKRTRNGKRKKNGNGSIRKLSMQKKTKL